MQHFSQNPDHLSQSANRLTCTMPLIFFYSFLIDWLLCSQYERKKQTTNNQYWKMRLSVVIFQIIPKFSWSEKTQFIHSSTVRNRFVCGTVHYPHITRCKVTLVTPAMQPSTSSPLCTSIARSPSVEMSKRKNENIQNNAWYKHLTNRYNQVKFHPVHGN